MSESAGITRWQVPPVEHAPAPPEDGGAQRLTVRDLEAIQEQAHRAGFEQGRQDGQAAVAEQAMRLEALLRQLQEPLADLDEEVLQQLVAVVRAMTRKLVRREMRADPGQIIAVMREAIGALPSFARNIKVHLHPDDVQLVRETLAVPQDGAAWSLVEDPVLERGDCCVRTDTSRVDATLESRLNALVAGMLGGERDGERGKGA